MNEGSALTYDDVALVPHYSEIESRHDCDITVSMGKQELQIPLIGAPMDMVCGPEMCIELSKQGAIGVLHRYCSIEESVEMFEKVKSAGSICFVAVGATGDGILRADYLYEKGCRHFCIDVAHGNHLFVKNTIKTFRSKYGDDIHIMAGNVCDYNGALNCFRWGADSIRVGVGGGSVCTTRLVTGHGVPNLTAIQQAVQARTVAENELEKTLYVIADGGIRTSGDAAKAFAFGADLVMVGSLLAGTDETPPVIEARTNHQVDMLSDGVEFRGMASREAQKANGRVSIVEGVATKVTLKGPVENVLQTFSGGLKSALSYTGALNLNEFRLSASYVKVSASSVLESKPHITLKNE